MPIKGLSEDHVVFVLDDADTNDQEPREPTRLRSVPGSTSS